MADTSTQNSVVEIRPDETFEHLSKAPIVEAVIDLRTRTTQPWEEEPIRVALGARLDGYTYTSTNRHFRAHFDVEQGSPVSSALESGIIGVCFQSGDQRQIAQFNRNGFVFSRLEPYQSWHELFSEAMRLWSIFCDLARPGELQRIGVRFINRIQMKPGETRFEDYIEPAPRPPKHMALPHFGFMYQDLLAVPGHPYLIKAIKMLPPTRPAQGRFSLILDIAVMTLQRVMAC